MTKNERRALIVLIVIGLATPYAVAATAEGNGYGHGGVNVEGKQRQHQRQKQQQYQSVVGATQSVGGQSSSTSVDIDDREKRQAPPAFGDGDTGVSTPYGGLNFTSRQKRMMDVAATLYAMGEKEAARDLVLRVRDETVRDGSPLQRFVANPLNYYVTGPIVSMIRGLIP